MCTMSKTKANEYIGMPRYRLKSDLKPKGMRKKGFEKQTIWKKEAEASELSSPIARSAAR